MALRSGYWIWVAAIVLILVKFAQGQGETTSAIVGSVIDPAGAAISGAMVTVTNLENGLKRSVKTDDSGRFSFPQLKPGIYSVQAEADRFEPQQNNSVSARLGQAQTVDFKLNIASASATIQVQEQAPLINPENPNTSTTLNARTLEDLPNPGGDLTYPLQFAAGALINTAGSGNDFVGGTNGYGNVQFNGLPALSNGYIVDGLETNDPLTNLNSGLATNLVLGLNSIAEVTVNTLSYAVDQGRYGASQVNYVTKSGTNLLHGNLYELWNGSKLNAADFFTNATAGNHKPRSTVNHFGGSLGGPIVHDKLFFFFDSEWVRIALPDRHCHHGADARLSELRAAAVAARWRGCDHRIHLSGRASTGAVLPEAVFAIRQYRRERRSQYSAARSIATEPLRPATRRMATAARTARAFRTQVTITNRCRPPASTTTSTPGTWRGSAFNPTRGLARPPTPIPSIRCSTPSLRSRLLFRRRLHARVFRASGELLQSGVFLVLRACSARRLQKTLAAFPIVLQGTGANAPFTTLGGLDNTWVQGRRARVSSSMTIWRGPWARMNFVLAPIPESSA